MLMQQWHVLILDTRNYTQKHILFTEPHTQTDKQLCNIAYFCSARQYDSKVCPAELIHTSI